MVKIAGSGGTGFTDALGTSATFTNPRSMTLDTDNYRLLISEFQTTATGKIRAVSLETLTVCISFAACLI